MSRDTLPALGEPHDPEFSEYYDAIDVLAGGMLQHGKDLERRSVEVVLWELSLWMHLTRERIANEKKP